MVVQHTLQPYGIGNEQPFTLIAGPCVVESADNVYEIASHLQALCRSLGINYILRLVWKRLIEPHIEALWVLVEKALDILANVKDLEVKIITDVHDIAMVNMVEPVVDFLQIPAFLCRQTELLQHAAATMLPVNIKKGQFLAPKDMRHVLDKVLTVGNENILLYDGAHVLAIIILWLISVDFPL